MEVEVRIGECVGVCRPIIWTVKMIHKKIPKIKGALASDVDGC